jgi:glycosyltransferase involved in cell wall biosynthesis
MSSLPDLVVFSHLRWGFVHQRPQHLLNRLAGRWRIVFVEEPVLTQGEPFMEMQVHGEHLTVLVPHTRVAMPGFHDDQLAELQPLVSQWLETAQIQRPVVWLYTPMALPLVQALSPSCVVYDCMDELSAFKGAPRQLRQREAALMKRAAVVFTGGPSLFEAKRHLHPNVHCIPSSVDAAHYSPANLVPGSPAHQAVQTLQPPLRGPCLGYFGVIDERLDLSLVEQLADHNPDWQVVMVGPVVKIDPASLPQRPNIHWLGMQAYERLPYFCAAWDICLMPFAQNEATAFISPTKTLEYMAAGKPVVSTPIKDVITLYGSAVQVAHSPAAFVQACSDLLQASQAEQQRLAEEMDSLVSTSSWERSANSIHALMSASREASLRTADVQQISGHSVEPATALAADARQSRYAVGAARP